MMSLFKRAALSSRIAVRKPVLLCLLLGFTMAPAYAQQAKDSAHAGSVRMDISGGFYYQMGFVPIDKRREILQPAYLSVRRPREPEVAGNWGLNGNNVTDNPVGHGASYIRFHSWYDITDEVEIYGSLTADHRGFSFGPYNTFAMVVIPRYHVEYRQKFGLGESGDSLSAYGKLGTFEALRSGEGLMLYNLDVQGLEVAVQKDHLRFSVLRIGDLKAGVGLNLDDVADFRLSLQQLPIGDEWKADIKVGVTDLLDERYEGMLNIVSLSGAAYTERMKIYGEAGYRFSDYGFDAVLNYAALAGIQGKLASDRLDLNYGVEYRHYGGGFNYRLRDETNTHYRDTKGGQGANYTGEQVYPLEHLNRPFGQWAVFTEYDKRWVGCASLAAQLIWHTGRYVQVLAETDFNLVMAEGEDAFLYPFFKAGFRVEAVKGTYIAGTITNKTMNLDKHYPTYYLLSYPVLQLELRRDISL